MKNIQRWFVDLRILKRHALLPDGTPVPGERIAHGFFAPPDHVVVQIDDPSVPERDKFMEARAQIRAHNVAQRAAGLSDEYMEPEPESPPHFQHTLVSFKSPVGLDIFEQLLNQLGPPWNVTQKSGTSGKAIGGTAVRQRIEGFVYTIGSDWIVKLGTLMAGNDISRGIVLEARFFFFSPLFPSPLDLLEVAFELNCRQAEYLPVEAIVHEGGVSAFIYEYMIKLLPDLPGSANFIMKMVDEESWASITAVDSLPPPPPYEEEIYVYGDEEEAVDHTSKDDYRREAYVLFGFLHDRGEE